MKGVSDDLRRLAQQIERATARWPKMKPEAVPLAAASECIGILRDAALQMDADAQPDVD